MDTVGTRIRALRVQKGWSQEQLAQYMGYSTRSSLSKFESGLRIPPDSVVAGLAVLLNVTPEFLRYGKDPEEKAPKFTGAKGLRINGRPRERQMVQLYPSTLAQVRAIAKKHGIPVAEAMDQIVRYAVQNLAD